MYTSGCPKNQNKWTNKTGSPNPIGSKNLVLKLRSVNSIVNPPASTGIAKTNKKEVTAMHQANIPVRSSLITSVRIPTLVIKKLIDAIIEEAPPI